MMSEFTSPWVGEAGVRVSSGSGVGMCLVGSWSCTPAAGAESLVLQSLVPILAAAVAR